VLHRSEHIAGAERHLSDFVCNMVAEAVASGEIRSDVSAEALGMRLTLPSLRPAAIA
jgi:hypothetical protein